MSLLSRFSTVERERRLRLAFEALGETGVIELWRTAKVTPGAIYPILRRWELDGVVTSRQQEWWEKTVTEDGERLPARRLYRLAERTGP